MVAVPTTPAGYQAVCVHRNRAGAVAAPRDGLSGQYVARLVLDGIGELQRRRDANRGVRRRHDDRAHRFGRDRDVSRIPDLPCSTRRDLQLPDGHAGHHATLGHRRQRIDVARPEERQPARSRDPEHPAPSAVNVCVAPMATDALSGVTTIVLSGPVPPGPVVLSLLWHPITRPAATSTAPAINPARRHYRAPMTAVGSDRSLVVPSPSWPSLLLPQQYAVPLGRGGAGMGAAGMNRDERLSAPHFDWHRAIGRGPIAQLAVAVSSPAISFARGASARNCARPPR